MLFRLPARGMRRFAPGHARRNAKLTKRGGSREDLLSLVCLFGSPFALEELSTHLVCQMLYNGITR
jgi:hypothetical protein